MAKVNHINKTARLYDSMTKAESDFKVPLQKVLSNTYKLSVSKNAPQPTGGFVAGSLEEFKEPNYSGGVPKKLWRMRMNCHNMTSCLNTISATWSHFSL